MSNLSVYKQLVFSLYAPYSFHKISCHVCVYFRWSTFECVYPHVATDRDFEHGPHVVLFDVGTALSSKNCTTITSNEDEMIEDYKPFTVQISSVSLTESVSIHNDSMQTAKIIDNGKLFILQI